MNFGRQLWLILWKNITLRRRQPIRFFIEITWPIVLLALLALVRTRNIQSTIPEVIFFFSILSVNSYGKIFQSSVRSIDWLIEWIIVRLIVRLIDWLIEWSFDRLIDWLNKWWFDWSFDWLIAWFDYSVKRVIESWVCLEGLFSNFLFHYLLFAVSFRRKSFTIGRNSTHVAGRRCGN